MEEYGNDLLVLVRRRSEHAPEQKKNGMPDPEKEKLLGEGFSRMGWPPYDPDRISRTRTGKPYVTDPQVPGEFNYSDTDTCCAAAFGSAAVGIDIEEIRKPPVHLLRRLPEEERRYLHGTSDPAERNYRFVRIWTAKEAFGKMQGTGLTKEILETDFTRGTGGVIPVKAFSVTADTLAVRMTPVRVMLCGTACLFGCCDAGAAVISVCMKIQEPHCGGPVSVSGF